MVCSRGSCLVARAPCRNRVRPHPPSNRQTWLAWTGPQRARSGYESKSQTEGGRRNLSHEVPEENGTTDQRR